MSSEFYTRNGWKGEKYDRELSTKDAAKLIRRDIRLKYGKDLKTSVRTEHFAGGSAINIKVKDWVQNPINPDWYPKGQWNSIYNQRYTEDGRQLLHDLKEIANQYRWEDSDSMIDYCSCNFYLSVSSDYAFERKAIDELRIKLPTL